MINLTPEKIKEYQKTFNVGQSTGSKGRLVDRLKKIKESQEKPRGILENVTKDISETGSGIVSSLKERGNKFLESYKAGASGEQTPVETGFQYAGNVLGAGFDVLGNLAMGAGKAVLPESAEKAVKSGVERVVGSKPVQSAVSAYESLPARTRRNIGAAGNIVSVLPVGGAASAALKPVSKVVSRATKAAARGVSRGTKNAVNLTKDVIKTGASKVTGMEPETLRSIFRNPEKFTRKSIESTDREAFAQGVAKDVSKKARELSQTGKGYETIRGADGSVAIPRKSVRDLLSDQFGIKYKGGKVSVNKESRAQLSKAEASKLDEFLKKYATTDNLSNNAFLNARQALDKLSKWEGGIGKSAELDRVARSLRKFYDIQGKGQIKGLESIDKKFKGQVDLLNKIKGEIIETKGPYKGDLKPNAISKLANLTGKGKERLLSELEKVRPGIGEQVKIMRAVEDYVAAKGNKVGAYGSGILTAAGVGTFLGHPWLLASILAYPPVAINLIRSAGTVAKFGRDIVEGVVKKVKSGAKLTPADRSVLDEAFSKTKPSRKIRETIKEKAPQSYDKIFSGTLKSGADDILAPVKKTKEVVKKKSKIPNRQKGAINLGAIFEDLGGKGPAKSAPKKLYHGTRAPEFSEFKGISYFTSDPKEALGFARGSHLGGKTGGKERVVEVSSDFKKVKSIDKEIADDLMEGDVDVGIERELAVAKKEGYDAVSFNHPSNYTDGEFTAYVPVDNSKVSLKPSTKSFKATVYRGGSGTSPSAPDLVSSIKKAKASGQSFDEWVKGQINKNDEVLMEVPVSKISTSEPSMAAERLKNAGKRKITEPIEVIKNITPQAVKEYGEWVVLDGHHRLQQAKVNGDKFIPSKVTYLETLYDKDGSEIGNKAVSRSQLKAEWDKVNSKK